MTVIVAVVPSVFCLAEWASGVSFSLFFLFSLLPSLAFGVGNWTLGRQSRRSPAPVPSRFDGCCVISWCETLQQGRCLGRLGRESRWRGKYQGYDVNRAINSSDEESEDGEREREREREKSVNESAPVERRRWRRKNIITTATVKLNTRNQRESLLFPWMSLKFFHLFFLKDSLSFLLLFFFALVTGRSNCE